MNKTLDSLLFRPICKNALKVMFEENKYIVVYYGPGYIVKNEFSINTPKDI